MCSVELTLNNGMHILQKDLDYPSLYRLIPQVINMVVSSFFVYLYRKKQDTDKLQQLIVQKRELLARETFSRRAFNRYEDMSDE